MTTHDIIGIVAIIISLIGDVIVFGVVTTLIMLGGIAGMAIILWVLINYLPAYDNGLTVAQNWRINRQLF